MEPVRLGVVGCGVIGRVHLDRAVKSPLLTPVAIAEVRDDVRRNTAAKFGMPKAYATIGRLLKDPAVEAVTLALPTNLRSKLAPKVLRAGKHLLLEKPAAMNAREIRKLIALRGDRVAAVCSARNRCNEAARIVRDTLASGQLGHLRVVRLRAIRPVGGPPKNAPPVWRLRRDLNGGGIFVNWGSYDIDFLLGVSGWSLEPRIALARMWSVADALADRAAPGSDAETHLTALIHCADGISIQYERAEFAACAPDGQVQFIGDKGTLRLNNSIEACTQIDLDLTDPASGVSSRTLWTGKVEHQDGHLGVPEDFARAIRENRPPLTSLENALVAQRLTDAVYRSAMTGKAAAV